jgi:hypothetical protein
MPQTFTEFKTPFSNMSFTPDIPAAALQPTEYNAGYNVETDTRGIRSVFGDEEILSTIPGQCIFVSGGYRGDGNYWYIVGTIQETNKGRWYAISATGIRNVTPGYDAGSNPNAYLPNYSAEMPITDSWNGTVLFVNDSQNPPMYLLPGYISDPTTFQQYSNSPSGPGYIWNYDTTKIPSTLTAGFMRQYSSPNVGSLLIAGNLTYTNTSSSIVTNYPTTVRWSQAFGVNSGPTTWAPSAVNVANELEVPVRGPVVDGFPIGANFYVCSYWDTVVFSPINYQGTNYPVFAVRLLNQGRGLLNENCWSNADTQVFGLDARDIWSFDGNNFKSLGNQRVKNYFYDNLNPLYKNRVFTVNNTSKNQFEIYYPDLTSTGWCNKMLAYRYDLDVFQSPRTVDTASHASEGPIFDGTIYNDATRTAVYSRAVTNGKIVQKDQGTSFLGNVAINTQFRRDNIGLGLKYSQQALVHRILPEVINIDTAGIPVDNDNLTGNITIQIGGADSVGQQPTFKPAVTIAVDTSDPWCQIDQNAYRVNTLEISNSSATDTWQCTAVNWQFTPTQDSR